MLRITIKAFLKVVRIFKNAVKFKIKVKIFKKFNSEIKIK